MRTKEKETLFASINQYLNSPAAFPNRTAEKTIAHKSFLPPLRLRPYERYQLYDAVTRKKLINHPYVDRFAVINTAKAMNIDNKNIRHRVLPEFRLVYPQDRLLFKLDLVESKVIGQVSQLLRIKHYFFPCS